MSANRRSDHDPLIHPTLATVGAMIEANVPVMGWCGACKTSWPLDLDKIAKRRGPYWTLYGRRLRCPTCRREAVIHAKGAGGFTWPISGEQAANYTATKSLRARCSWCGKSKEGHGP